MDFPYTPKYLMHRSGSKILAITGLTHECYPPSEGFSQDIWCAKCTVQWSDTGKTSEASVQIGNICYDGGQDAHAELCEFSNVVSEYLREHGDWNHDENEGPQGWYAHRLSKKSRERAHKKPPRFDHDGWITP